MNIPVYVPRDSAYKNPFGAVANGTGVLFRIALPRSLNVSGAELVIHRDSTSEQNTCTMEWDGMNGDDREWWSVSFTPDTPDLYYYHFEYTTAFGRFYVYKGKGGLGHIGLGDENFQLTVYSKEFSTPTWLRGGIIYQIFPDRFAKSATPKENVPKNRVLRDDWGGVPHWKPDEHGEILNNDFFGGDLQGIAEKLPYLQELGVTCIYLNPVVQAYSNHRYDTGDYLKVDPLLGTRHDFKSLCIKAREHGMNVMIDGVFSHTGADSVYFNKYKTYGTGGAYNDKNSPYFAWYSFKHYPNDYESWWGIQTLPEVREESKEFIEFITGKDGVISQWLSDGAKAIRLDVADELPDMFLDALRKGAKEYSPETIVLGEVWEDASNKYSYGDRRRYLLGDQLDSVMNYPFKDAILEYLISGNADNFADRIYSILENYPSKVIHLLMNHIGTHDTVRAITALAGEPARHGDRVWQHDKTLTEFEYSRGKVLLKMASSLQYTLPGVPSVYYGDEVGMQGYNDPFNRGCFPWGDEDTDLFSWYKSLSTIRRACPALVDGAFESISSANGCVAFSRSRFSDKLLIVVNRNSEELHFELSDDFFKATVLLSSDDVRLENSAIHLPPMSVCILGKGKWTQKMGE